MFETKNNSKYLWAIPIVVALIALIPFLYGVIFGQTQITIENRLARPVKVFINKHEAGRVSSYSKRTFTLYSKDEFPAKVEWEVVPMKDDNGTQVGDKMESDRETLVDRTKTMIIKQDLEFSKYFFFPVITNKTNKSCEIIVNDGLVTESHVGFLSPYKQNVGLGYYLWAPNSNITLICEGVVYFWGRRNGQYESIFNFENEETGVIHFTHAPKK